MNYRGPFIALAALTLMGISIDLMSLEDFRLSGLYPSPVGIYRKMTTLSATRLARDDSQVAIGRFNSSYPADPGYKLDVDGPARVGGVINLGSDSGDPVLCSRAGTLRWYSKSGDPNTNTLQVCDGANWVLVNTRSATPAGSCSTPGATQTSPYRDCSCGSGSLIWEGSQTSTCTANGDGTFSWKTTSTDCSPPPPGAGCP